MALLLHCLLLLGAIFSACTISTSDVNEVDDRIHIQNVITLYPETFMLVMGPYSSSGKYVASGEFFDGYPVYTGPNGSTYWKIYYRSGGAFAGHWVLNGNVHEDAHGTVAYFDNLFSPKI